MVPHLKPNRIDPRRRSLLALWLVVLAVVVVAPVSCAEATAVRVHAYTDVKWESGRRVIVAASSQGAPTASEPLAEVTGPWSSPDLGDFVLLPGGDRGAPVRIAVVMGITKDAQACSVESPEGCIFVRRKLGFVEHRTLTVPMTVYAACIGVPCTADTTCNALGQCVSAEVEPGACASNEGCFLPGEAPPASLREPASDAGEDVSDAGADASDGGAEPGLGAELALGSVHTCRRLADGGVACWGKNSEGQLGLGDTTDRGGLEAPSDGALPAVDLGAGRSARALAAGGVHTCAQLDDGRVKCWGANDSGQLGLGDNRARGSGPGQMGDALPALDFGPGRTTLTLAAGAEHTCALLDNGGVTCWGDNSHGQLGLGDVVGRDRPATTGAVSPYVSLGGEQVARALVAGWGHTCALLESGQVKCWGDNSSGQLGVGDSASRGDQSGEMGDNLPFVALGGHTALSLASGGAHTCALLENHEVRCWGDNSSGQLGVGDPNTRGNSPGAEPTSADLGTGRTARAIAAGASHTCALLDNDQIKCWGANWAGQLGLRDTRDRGITANQMGDALPFVDLGPGRSARAVAAGSTRSCAVLDDGRLKCWGELEPPTK